jgi:RHS repeat-associated protein
MEENLHYSYGLRIAAISSRKFGDVSEGEIVNQILYNGKEMLDEDADLGWIDYGFRNYDPQIGRFPQLDPLADDYPLYTPYQYAGNDPITNIDIDGLEPGQSVLSTTLETAKTLETIVITGPKASNNVNRIWGLVNVIGSTLEVAGGVALGVTTAWTGFGAVAGGAIAVHGLDGLSAGLTQLITGQETKPYSEKEISKGFQKAGISKENADIYAAYGNDALSMFSTGGAGKLLKFTKAPVKAIPKAKVVPKVNNVAAKGVVNQTSKAILKNGYYEVNGFKFSEYYYNKLWSTGRGAPSLVANEVLQGGAKTAVPDALKAGFNKYIHGGWEMIYNPATKEVWHLQPIR